jgi:hypothetical protein
MLLEREFGGWFASCTCGWRGWAIEATHAAARWDFSLHVDDLVGLGTSGAHGVGVPARRRRFHVPVKLHVLPPLYSMPEPRPA